MRSGSVSSIAWYTSPRPGAAERAWCLVAGGNGFGNFTPTLTVRDSSLLGSQQRSVAVTVVVLDTSPRLRTTERAGIVVGSIVVHLVVLA